MPDGFPYRFTAASFVAQAAASGHVRHGDEARFLRCFQLYADDLVERGHWRRDADGFYSVNRRAAAKMAYFAARIDPATARLRRIQRAKAAIRRHEAAEAVGG